MIKTSLNVGGGLVPMAVDQSIDVTTDTLLSGASPLLHLDWMLRVE
ncbi:hypothetical protein ACVWXD_000364 [Pseudomonas sp. TE3911]